MLNFTSASLGSIFSGIKSTQATSLDANTTSEINVATVEKYSLLSLSCLSFFTNAMVCLVILTDRKLRKRGTNIYVVSFCITQMLVGGVLLPLYCFIRHHALYNHLSALIIISYACHLTAVTRDRLQAVQNALRYNELVIISRVVKTVIFCWFLSIATQFLPFIWIRSSQAMLIQKIFLVTILVVFLILPLFFICYTYVIIFHQINRLMKRTKTIRLDTVKTETLAYQVEGQVLIRKLRTPTQTSTTSSPHISSERRRSGLIEFYYLIRSIVHDRENDGVRYRENSDAWRQKLSKSRFNAIRAESKAAVVFAIVAITYALSWFPVIFMTFLDVIERKDLEPGILKHISAILIGLNSLTDSLVYGVLLKDVRKRFRNIFNLCHGRMQENFSMASRTY